MYKEKKENIISWTITIIFLMVICSAFLAMVIQQNQLEEKCKKLGYDDYETANIWDFQYRCIKEVPSNTGVGYTIVYSGWLKE